MADSTPQDAQTPRTSNENEHYDLVDIYTSYNFAEAELIRDILEDNQIECFVRSLQPSQFPLNVGKHGEIRVTVPNDAEARARAILKEAIAQQALSGDGTFNPPSR